MTRKMQIFYHFHTVSLDACSMAKEACEQAERTWLCKGCHYPKRDTQAVDVIVQSPGPKKVALTFVYGFGIPIAHRAFLECFDDAVIRDLHLGRVYLENGKQLSDWVTFRGKFQLIVRGTRNVSHRVCGDCGRNVYFAMGSRYLFPAPPRDHELFESDLWGLIVSQSMFDRVALNKWPKLVFDKLPVLPSPKDALPALLASYTSPTPDR